LVQWKGSVTQCGAVVTSTGGDAAPGRGKGGDDISWADANLTEPKNKKKSTLSIQLLQMNGENLKQQ
jgi:hypothetical protein